MVMTDLVAQYWTKPITRREAQNYNNVPLLSYYDGTIALCYSCATIQDARKLMPGKDFPTSVRLTSEMVSDLKKIDKDERGVNWLIRYAIVKFLIDFKKEGLRDDVKARLA
jgi:hypothetical protein